MHLSRVGIEPAREHQNFELVYRCRVKTIFCEPDDTHGSSLCYPQYDLNKRGHRCSENTKTHVSPKQSGIRKWNNTIPAAHHDADLILKVRLPTHPRTGDDLVLPAQPRVDIMFR